VAYASRRYPITRVGRRYPRPCGLATGADALPLVRGWVTTGIDSSSGMRQQGSRGCCLDNRRPREIPGYPRPRQPSACGSPRALGRPSGDAVYAKSRYPHAIPSGKRLPETVAWRWGYDVQHRALPVNRLGGGGPPRGCRQTVDAALVSFAACQPHAAAFGSETHRPDISGHRPSRGPPATLVDSSPRIRHCLIVALRRITAVSALARSDPWGDTHCALLGRFLVSRSLVPASAIS
jgi:hypothetical protein